MWMTVLFSLIYTSDSHITDLRCFLSQLQAAGFTPGGSKCSFGMSSTTHLAFEYFSEGIRSSTEKAHAVADWPTPRSPKRKSDHF